MPSYDPANPVDLNPVFPFTLPITITDIINTSISITVWYRVVAPLGVSWIVLVARGGGSYAPYITLVQFPWVVGTPNQPLQFAAIPLQIYEFSVTSQLGVIGSVTLTLAAIAGPLFDPIPVPPGRGPGPTPGPSTDPTLAIELGPLPQTLTQNVRVAGVTQTVWYKYTAQPGDIMIGVFPFGDLVNYLPTCNVYDGLANAQADFVYLSEQSSGLSSTEPVPVQIPVFPGNVYYFKIIAPDVNATPAILTISALRAPNLYAPVDSIAVNDDTDGFALALFSPAGAMLKFIRPFPAGETAAILPNGTLLVTGNGAHSGFGVFIYDAAYIQRFGPIALTFAVVNLHQCMNSDRLSTFYISDYDTVAGIARVTTINAITGLQGPTTWTPTTPGGDLIAMAPSHDNTILYYISSVTDPAIRRWDLVNNVSLSNLTSGPPAGYTPAFTTQDLGGIYVLADGTILVGYFKSETDSIVVRYSATGTIIRTFAIAAQLNYMAFATDDPLSFWVWVLDIQGFLGYSVYQHIRVSDGTLLSTTGDVIRFEVGQYTKAPITATPQARFGPSSSCAFWLLPSGVPLSPGGCLEGT